RIDLANTLDDASGAGGIERVELEQAVAALAKFLGQFLAEGDGFLDQRFPGGGGPAARAPGGEGQQALAEGVPVDFAAVQRRFERVETAVIPVEHAFLGAALKKGHVDPDGLRLPDT